MEDNRETNMENKAKDNNQPLMEIVVNGKRKPWISLFITTKQVVSLAYGLYQDRPHITYTITYAHGENNSQGSLLKDDKIPAVMNMVFNVSMTDKS